jgi:DNA mismatch repair ATPase MutS
MTHPLLATPVPNDLRLDGRSWLVTGSNMSGKSTFLRTIGVNALLARTIYTVFATRWEGASVAVRTCIGRADSIVEGKSYYLAEVERVRFLLDESLSPEPRLFILDELFRGTNTIERVAAARATLEALDVASHVVVVATHDIELLRWLDGRYAAYHFREQIADGVLSFDHRLYAGPSSTRNAIALLRLMKYPESVVRMAELTAAEEEDGKLLSQQQREPGRE